MKVFQEARNATRIDKKGIINRKQETLYFMYDGETGDIIGCFYGIKRVVRFLIEECDYMLFLEGESYDKNIKTIERRIQHACRVSNCYLAGYLWSYERRENYYDGINDKEQRHNVYGKRVK